MMLEPWVGWGDDPSPTFSADDFFSYFTMTALLHLSLSPTYTFFALLWLFLLTHPLNIGIWGRGVVLSGAHSASHATQTPMRSQPLPWLPLIYRKMTFNSADIVRTLKSGWPELK